MELIKTFFFETVKTPFFWAFLAAFGWALASLVIASKSLGKNVVFGIFAFMMAEIPRAVMSLPIIKQPRFSDSVVFTILGIILFIVAFIFGSPSRKINPFVAPDKNRKLLTTGFFGIVRHPIMFSDSFWPIGFALIFKSTIGLIVSILIAIYIYFFTYLEEDQLIHEYGDEYAEYRKKVPRIIPFVKFL